LADSLAAVVSLPALETTGTDFRGPPRSLLPKCYFGRLKGSVQLFSVVDSARHNPLENFGAGIPQNLRSGSRSSTACSTDASESSVRQRRERFRVQQPIGRIKM
jgi:hypothetical protein